LFFSRKRSALIVDNGQIQFPARNCAPLKQAGIPT
jgi:hypothetical protein